MPVAGVSKRKEAEADGKVAVSIAAPAGARRYRAGLGPFGREPQTLAVTPAQLAALQADPLLAVNVVG